MMLIFINKIIVLNQIRSNQLRAENQMEHHFIMTLDLLFTIVEKIVSLESINLLKGFDKTKIIKYLQNIFFENQSNVMKENSTEIDAIISSSLLSYYEFTQKQMSEI